MIVSGKSDAESADCVSPTGSAAESDDASARRRPPTTSASGSIRPDSTGTPKGAVHLHSDLIHTAELLRATDARHRRRTMSFSRRPSCFSPTASATR